MQKSAFVAQKKINEKPTEQCENKFQWIWLETT